VNVTGQGQIWLRSLDTLDTRALPITDNVVGFMFWSPDSRAIAFTALTPAAKLKRIDIAGGPAQTLCDINVQPLGAWGRGGVIIIRNIAGLMRVSEAGGLCTPLTTLDTKRGELRQTAPSFLPDGKHFLYLRVFPKSEDSGVYIGSLDAKPEQQTPRRLLAGTSAAVYTPSAVGASRYLLFLREGSLIAQPFDPLKLAFTGDAQPVAEQVGVANDAPFFSTSDTGSLTYRIGGAGGSNRLVWYDRTGQPIGTVSEPGDYNTVALSPDGTRVAFQRTDAQGNNIDIWVQELTTGRRTRFTTDPARDWMPVWSADSERVVFGNNPDGGTENLYEKATSGAGIEVALLKTAEPKFPQDLSRDGRFLLYANNSSKNGLDLWVLPLLGERKPKLIVGTQFRETTARFSPDGHFIAYTSDATGRTEVYVRPFSPGQEVTTEWPVSKDGGTEPVRRQDGKELFFISADSKMMAVTVTTTPTFPAGIPQALFPVPIFGGGSVFNVHRWDTLDGKRFLINSATTATSSTPITVVLNWQAGLKK
jgi:WD40 repeat protein